MARRFFDIASAINATALNDDSAAFEYLFDAYYEKIYRVAFYYLHVDAHAEDAVSEVFYKLWLNRKKLPKIESLDSYLFSMIKNQSLSFLRSNKKLTFPEESPDFYQKLTLVNPESQLISEEFIRFIDQHINDLPPRCRIIFVMVKEDGMKYKEVADILNISVKTVENQMTKAIGHIRKLVNQYQAGNNLILQSE